jgi:SAM-dependent methyltransferase
LDSPSVGIYEDLADFYEELHAGREKDFLFYRALVSDSCVRVLDLACGTGEIASRLASAGATVTGLDASETMLSLAQERHASIRWLLGDMRAFQLVDRFDLVVCGLNSLQHLETDAHLAAALNCVREHLVSDGRFAFDIFNPSNMFLGADRHDVMMRRFFSTVAGRELVLYEDTHYNAATALLHIDWRLVEAVSGRRVAESRSIMRQIFPAGLDALLAAAGFVMEAKYGDFDRTPFAPSSAKQIVVVRRT